MGVFGDIYFIVAAFNFIPRKAIVVFIVGIVGCHVADVEGERHRLAFTGGEQAGFCIIAEFDMRFFDPAVGIRRAVIKLNDVLTCNLTSICHPYVYGNCAVLRKFYAVCGRGFNYIPREIGV